MMTGKRLSRRQFLAAGSSLAVGALLSACARAPTSTAAEEEVPQPASREGQEIHFLCRPDIRSAYAADKAVEAWNKQFESKITLDEPAGDLVQKVQAAQAAGNLIWDGYSVMETPWATTEWVKRGLIQPLDEYIQTSSIPDAPQVVPGIIPSILEASKYEGRQYGIPGNVGSVALAWFWEPLRGAGYESQPMTWDEVYDAARKIKEKYPHLIPFDSAYTPLCDLYAMIWGATDEPFDEDGLIDITGEASIAALNWMRKLVREELMPPAHGDSFQNWLKGGTAIITSYDVAGTMAQQTFGMEKADTGINFFREKGKTRAGTPFWINCSVLWNQARNPQGMTDFFLWWFSPSNKATGQRITEVAAKPCYQYTYDEFIKGRPEFEWELRGIELVRNSKWFPTNLAFNIERAVTAPWVEKVLDLSQNVDPKEAMENALKEIKNELARLKFD